ncbi:MAG: NUDIX domain-containing protein [Alphaproteobacteria bacterium]|nr:MAG: NUDIX domain-containing protein [Alphaproteobacteria bacterium]
MTQHKRPALLSPFDLADINIKSDEVVYQGYASVHEVTFEHPTFAGTQKLEVTREIFVSGNAVVVIPFDPVLNEICLIEQIRMAPLMAGDHPWLIEAIAGRIDDGTDAEAIARKEAEEEAGCTLSDLINFGTYYQSPGIFAEEITYFIARADLSSIGGTHGLDSENEDIRALRLTLDEAFEALATGLIRNAPTAFALQYLQLHAREIRVMWQR